MPPQNQHENTSDQISNLIHGHNKVRYGTACYPCKQRKVKCDNTLPCKNCQKRDYPDLCSYVPKDGGDDHGRPVKRQRIATPTTTTAHETKVPSRPAEHSRVNSSTGNSRPTLSRTSEESSEKASRTNGSQSTSQKPPTKVTDADGEISGDEGQTPRYLGENSLPAFFGNQSSPQGNLGNEKQAVLGTEILPMLGLQNPAAPYPFMAANHIEDSRREALEALPPNREILRTFHNYRQNVHPFWHILLDIDAFESSLCAHLEDLSLASSPKDREMRAQKIPLKYLGMLFAILASGVQFSELPRTKRFQQSQSFVQQSFECLKITNFLLQPSLESIQNLLILGHVLQNDMKAEAAWALLGMTSRLAQSLGLHKHSRLETTRATQRLWWAVAWQDGLLSLSFDRSPVTTVTDLKPPLSATALTEGYTYTEATYCVCQTVLKAVGSGSASRTDYNEILNDVAAVENVFKLVLPRLRSKEDCKTIQDRLEYFLLRLHASFVISTLCRPALSRQQVPARVEPQRSLLAQKCKASLTDVLRSYLQMNSLGLTPTRSWTITHNGLSSALLLGILGETKTNPEVRDLQGRLINVLTTIADDDGEADYSKSDLPDPILTSSNHRALTALKNIYDHGWVIDPQIVARPAEMVGDEATGENRALVPVQDGAEHANGEMTGNAFAMDSNTAPQSMNQLMDMSPMDLYDTIFWDQNLNFNDQAISFPDQQSVQQSLQQSMQQNYWPM